MPRVRLVLLLLVVFATLAPGAHATGSGLTVRGDALVDEAGRPVFLLGANYQGPADRAWRMWEDDLFDPRLIAEDLDRAASAGLRVLRIFIQRPLAADIQAGRWTKLDLFLDLVDQRGLRLIVTFADYPDSDLTRLAMVDTAVAGRYRHRSTILAYDLRNEPRFGDLALATYPRGATPPLQQAETVAEIGETIPRSEIAEYRASETGQREVPARLDDDRAYVYANLLAAYRAFLADAQNWVKANDGTILRFLASPDSAAWRPLIRAINDTYAAWLRPRVEALRAADPDRPLTIGHADPAIASLPASAWLDYQTLHRYPAPSGAGIRASMALFDDLRRALPNKPIVLGEFGFSNDSVDETTAAALEAELVRAARDRGGAGALKWMLNDFPLGANPRENAFGMFRSDGSAKPVVAALRGLAGLTPARPGSPTTCAAGHRLARTMSDGRWLVVGNTDGQGVYLRRTPRLADRLVAWPDNTRLEIVGTDAVVDGTVWRQVRDPCDRAGWVPARYVAPAAP